MSIRITAYVLFVSAAALFASATPAAEFHLKDATIDSIHAGIRSGATTCEEVVKQYVARAKAYNGMCAALVAIDGKPIAPATATVRTDVPIKFPTATFALGNLVPDFDKYTGSTPDYGHMEPTTSAPSVQMQYGMVAGTRRPWAKAQALLRRLDKA